MIQANHQNYVKFNSNCIEKVVSRHSNKISILFETEPDIQLVIDEVLAKSVHSADPESKYCYNLINVDDQLVIEADQSLGSVGEVELADEKFLQTVNKYSSFDLKKLEKSTQARQAAIKEQSGLSKPMVNQNSVLPERSLDENNIL